MARLLALIGCGVAALVIAAGAEAAAPRYILISGPGLERPILLADWSENLDLLIALIDAPRVDASAARLSSRRRFRLGLFWGWPERPLPTDPRDANQTGWFYPRTESQPAAIDLRVSGTRAPRVAPTRALRILARHGVPTTPGEPSTGGDVPQSCGPDEVRQLVRYFLRSFNMGDLHALDDAFADEPLFRWYSTDGPGARLRGAAFDRRSLIPYFSGRRGAGEALRLRAFRFTGNGNDGVAPYGNFTVALVRTTGRTQLVSYGKGAALCYENRPDVLIVWSMARRR